MRGIQPIFKKELSDHFSSYRFPILFALITMISLITVYVVGLNITKELEGIAKPKFVFLMLFTASGGWFSLVQFVAFFGPLIGLILGFDAISRERNEGTLSKLLSQPIYRDSVINGKFLAGIVIISLMTASIILLISGLGLIVLGIVPGWEEVFRMVIYLVISIVYLSFWMGVSILFSIIFRTVATSALAALAMWILFSFFIPLSANAISGALISDEGNNPESILLKSNIENAVLLISPLELYLDSTAAIIDPLRRTTKNIINAGMMEKLSMTRFAGPLLLSQSIIIVMPYMISLIAVTAICFAISYTIFMRQEIRSV